MFESPGVARGGELSGLELTDTLRDVDCIGVQPKTDDRSFKHELLKIILFLKECTAPNIFSAIKEPWKLRTYVKYQIEYKMESYSYSHSFKER